MFIVDDFASDNINVPANSITSNLITISCAKDGYTTLGCFAPDLENATSGGTLSSYCAVYYVNYNSNGNIGFLIRNNNSSSAAVVMLKIRVLYRKNV